MTAAAEVQLAAGAPFVSQAQLEESLAAAGVDPVVSQEIIEQNAASQAQALDASLGILALLALVSLFFTGRIPDRPVGEQSQPAEATSVT